MIIREKVDKAGISATLKFWTLFSSIKLYLSHH